MAALFSRAPARPTTILVVDDHAAYAELVVEVLSLEVFHAVALTTPRTVIPHLAVHQPDLILCDMQMPALDGLTLAWRIRQLSYTTPILLMRGVPQSTVDLPAVSFAAKTPDLDALLALVARPLS